MPTDNGKIDPITLEVIWSKLRNIPKEMGVMFKRTAFTEVIKYAEDFSTGIFTPDGRLIAQGTYTPGLLGGLPEAVRTVLADHVPPEEFRPGDVVITNDPYIASGHLPDVFLLEPVFHDDTLVGFSTAIGHHIDIGGPDPGSYTLRARDMYGEGLLLPPMKLYDAGEPVEEVLEILIANSRAPQSIRTDLRAQRKAIEKGSRLLGELVTEEGFDRVREFSERIIQFTEEQMRESIATVPDGSYAFTDRSDGVEETGPIPISAEVTVDGSELTVDFAGTADQVSGYSINSARNYTLAYTILAVKSAIDPDTPQTHGSLAPVEMVAPEGSIVNPTRPAPVASRQVLAERIVGAVSGALHQALPGEVPANGGQYALQVIEFDDPETEQSKVLHDGFYSGSGARAERDGWPAMSSATNVLNIPVESVETTFPVRVTQYRMLLDTAGAGEHRGGPGSVREWEFLDDATATTLNGRCIVPPYGLDSGEDGETGRLVLNPGTGEAEELFPRSSFEVSANDVLRVSTAGGGGYGPPAARDEAAVRRDVADGLVSAEQAEQVYGVDCTDD